MNMKVTQSGIDRINTEFIQKDLKKIKNNEENDQKTYASEDKVEISSKALDLKKMQDAAMKSPDVRTEKVAAIKTQVENGTYKISNEKIAERLIEENLVT